MPPSPPTSCLQPPPQAPALADLPKLTPKRLRDLWIKLGLRGEPPSKKYALLFGISWHLQHEAHGGLDARTRRLLKVAMRKAPVSARMKTKSDSSPITRNRHNKVTLRTGTTLIRTWHGTKHQVRVLNDGKRLMYRDKEYASLSEVARKITGARWSGPRFFGLSTMKGIS
ncbi:MAG: DUF2924 domain-containing protein [Phycisphaerales bacterium]|nr:DUF2924 domain-containing protein [Phycisphaerales bacterium]